MLNVSRAHLFSNRNKIIAFFVGITTTSLALNSFSGCSSSSATATAKATSTPTSTPTVSSISPTSGLYLGNTALTITGTGFVTSGTGPTVTLNVGSTSLTCTVTSSSTTSISCTTAVYAAGGATTVTVANPSGVDSSPYSSYTYLTPASFLGQSSATSSSQTNGTSTGMHNPMGIASDGTHLAVVDDQNSRVLLWNTIPTSSDQAADLVLGQSSMSSYVGNVGAGALSSPSGVALYQGQVIVGDYLNQRVLIWNSWPTSNGQDADVVIGQTTFSANGTGTTASTLEYPTGVAVDSSGHLYIADSSNNRVLYFSSIPTTNGASATFALGQSSLTTGSSGTSQSTLYGPMGVSANTDYVVVADTDNNRIMIYNNPPTANGPNAIAVLGQSSFTGSSSACASTGMYIPMGVYLDSNGNLYASDSGNNRVLYWSDVSSLSNGQAAGEVFGESSMSDCTANAGSIGQTTLDSPAGLFVDTAGYLWVSDHNNNRVTVNLW